MPENVIFCPSCGCEQVVKNGFTHNGNQNNKCKSCGRQFVLDPKNKTIEQETLILNRQVTTRETTSGARLRLVTGVSERWLQTYVNTLYTSIPKNVEVWPKKKGG